jgi:CRISPR-associated endonuclease Cas2
MARPRKIDLSFEEKIRLIKAAGISLLPAEVDIEKEPAPKDEEIKALTSLKERVSKILNIIRDKPIKATEMIYLVMYDIENNKIRTLIARYLVEKGCIRIQKSVYMVRCTPVLYQEIKNTLKEIQECYDNNDSMLLIPISANTPGSMEIIGRDVQIDSLVEKPNTLFF